MRLVGLVSSGIDSPVAASLVSQYAKEVVLVHADNRPFTDDREVDNFSQLAHHLKHQCNSVKKAMIVPHGITLQACRDHVEARYTCVICKRMMLRYAEAIAVQEKAEAVVMGDSLGQVASQTLQNIQVIEQAVQIPVLRPLIGWDKEDVVFVAKEIGTYDLSIARSAGCLAVPEKPSTRAVLERILAEEQKINVADLVASVVTQAVSLRL